jgi:hypothetical protein
MHNKLKNKVVILGSAETWTQAPFTDDSFEIWALNDMFSVIPRAEVWFEMHSISEIQNHICRGADVNYYDWYKHAQIPIYMQKKVVEIPYSIEYPLKEIIDLFGDYLTNTISYEIALAIYMGYEEIHLYGVNMALSEEYMNQRPSCEYYIGIAKGMGIKIHIPKESSLLKTNFLYGYDDKENSKLDFKINARIKELANLEEQVMVTYYKAQGAKDELLRLKREL